MKNKILHIVLKASYNGATIYATRLSTNLNEYNHEIVSCFNGNAFSEINNKIGCERLLSSQEVKFKYLILKYWRFFSFMRKKDYEIIHYHQGGVGILLLAYWFRKNAVVVHHLHSGNLIGDNTRQDISLFHLFILKYLSNKTKQVAVAQHVFNEYSKKIEYIKNIRLIKNSTPFVFARKQTRCNAVGFIGRFTEEKGFSSLSDISIKLKEKFPEIKILIMGDEPELFNKHFNELFSNITLIDPGLDTEKFYQSIDILLFLSIAPEGMPLVVLEAISFDVGVIAFRSPASKEIFGDDYPLLIKDNNELMKVLSEYYENKIDLNKLSSIHKNVNIIHNTNEMIWAIRKLYTNILD